MYQTYIELYPLSPQSELSFAGGPARKDLELLCFRNSADCCSLAEPAVNYGLRGGHETVF